MCGRSSIHLQKIFFSRSIARHRRFIRRTPIDGDLLRHAVAADRLGQEPLGGLLVALLSQQEIDGLARLIPRSRSLTELIGFMR